MSGYTPAPWTVVDTGVRDVGGYIVFTPRVFHYPNQDERYEKEILERKANAQLIAAAPELLEALQDLYGQVMQAKKGFGIYDSSPSMDKSIRMAETAIAKATGEQA